MNYADFQIVSEDALRTAIATQIEGIKMEVCTCTTCLQEQARGTRGLELKIINPEWEGPRYYGSNPLDSTDFDYLGDLNVCHRAELALTSRSEQDVKKIRYYLRLLSRVWFDDFHRIADWYWNESEEYRWQNLTADIHLVRMSSKLKAIALYHTAVGVIPPSFPHLP